MTKMSSIDKYYFTALAFAFITSVCIDVGGFQGWWFNLYESKVFEHAGHGALVDFHTRNIVFFIGILIYYISLFFFLLKNDFALVLSAILFSLSIYMIAIGGISVGTPFDGLLAWVNGFCNMALFNLRLSEKLKKKSITNL